MDLLNEAVLLKTKYTLFNLLIRDTSQFLCYEILLNLTYVTYKKMHFSMKCNFGRIAIQWFHIKRYSDYQYTKFQMYTFRVQKNVSTLVPRLLSIVFILFTLFMLGISICILLVLLLLLLLLLLLSQRFF